MHVPDEPGELPGAAGADSLVYIASIASLMAVMVFGQKYLGARRWIKMPGGQSLPALGMGETDPDSGRGRYFAESAATRTLLVRFHEGRSHRRRSHAMVLAQPDLGTALTYVPIAVMGIFLGGMQLEAGAGSRSCCVVGTACFPRSPGHVLKTLSEAERLTSFHGSRDSIRQGSGYQVKQSMIAVGSGGSGAEKARKHMALFCRYPKRISFSRLFPRNMDS